MDTPIYIISTLSKMITEPDLKDKRAKKFVSSLKDKHYGQTTINPMLQAIVLTAKTA